MITILLPLVELLVPRHEPEVLSKPQTVCQAATFSLLPQQVVSTLVLHNLVFKAIGLTQKVALQLVEAAFAG